MAYVAWAAYSLAKVKSSSVKVRSVEPSTSTPATPWGVASGMSITEWTPSPWHEPRHCASPAAYQPRTSSSTGMRRGRPVIMASWMGCPSGMAKARATSSARGWSAGSAGVTDNIPSVPSVRQPQNAATRASAGTHNRTSVREV